MELDERISQFRSDLLRWAETNLRTFPWRSETTPYSTFVAEVLLQKTLAEKVPPVYEEFLSRYPDLKALESADEGELGRLLEPLGFQNQRATALIDAATELGGEILDSEEALLELRYVGPYTANATLCFAFGRRRPVVDGNVVRIYNRVFGLDYKATDDDAWTFAERVLPDEDPQTFNLALLDFGAAVCRSSNPRCESCSMSEICLYYEDENV